MTATSPVSPLFDPLDNTQHRIYSLGRVVDRVSVKVIDTLTGVSAPVGTRREFCVSGYSVFKGYLHNREKIRGVLGRYAEDVAWMRTGHERYLDSDGYGYITGRIKDIIIRGGENLYPGEIESRLLEHPAIAEVRVLGVSDAKYGEVVASFLRPSNTSERRPGDNEIQKWVGQTLSKQKMPQYIFWIGDEWCWEQFPEDRKWEASEV